jgi:hypothetical protein
MEKIKGTLHPGPIVERPRGQGQVPMQSEPWSHRSEGMRCRSCMWYMAKQDRGTPGGQEMGRCRRRSPTMNGFPVVYAAEDWCGDHKLA